jgi:NADP-dependent aldehyde dehydrogenase
MNPEIPIRGLSLVAGQTVETSGATFHGYNPATGLPLDAAFFSASGSDVDRAVSAATAAFPALSATSGAERAKLLRAIADGLDLAAGQIVPQANLETALPIARLTGEVARTSGQMRLFAVLLEEGSWVNARIDTADGARTPPKPDVRSMLRPIGPVAVFGASNFPLAFSVAGGDTASALAAGNPVVVKAHPAHPGTSELVGHVIAAAVAACGLPAGVFSLLFDAGHEVGAALVQHAEIRAVAFTGSFRGGSALVKLAAERREPIPVYAEMGSTNPVFVLAGALAERGAELAKGLHASFTLGAGQFCTNPGLVFVASGAETFVAALREATETGAAHVLLTEGIAKGYEEAHREREELRTAAGAAAALGFGAQALLEETTFAGFEARPELAEEVFGPSTLLVQATKDEMLEAARALEGHLTATILGTADDLRENAALLAVLETKVGRVIFNAFPTGVEVCHAMVHGGPWPATSDGRSTSVGTRAIERFVRPVCWQGMPQSVLPRELRDENSLGILRLVDGVWKR